MAEDFAKLPELRQQSRAPTKLLSPDGLALSADQGDQNKRE
jgi:hypothetical protein